MTLPLRCPLPDERLVPRDAPAWPDEAGEAATSAPLWPAGHLPHRWGDWQIPEAASFELRLICAFHGESPSSVLARLIAAEGRAIGLSPALARHYGEDACAGHANSPDGDFHAVPEFPRTAASRFARR